MGAELPFLSRNPMVLAGKYEILSTLGSGSMGTVHLALDTSHDHRVALKTIRAGSTVDPEMRERFYREARICARLQHPSIVTVFDVGEAEGMAYIAMELLEGEDLKACIAKRQPFSLEARIKLMIQICEALDHAHNHEVVHRDIKPSNIFFVERENRAKILDFGIARLASSQLTLVGKVLGTPNYMAPEQILGRPCDGRSDLFSAAVVFFEFLTGAHPFQSTFIPRRIVRERPELLRDIDPNLPEALEAALATGLHKEPDCRFQTGEEFAATLKEALAHLAGLPVAAVRTPIPKARPTAPALEAGNQTEWQISEFLRLLHDFDSAAELQSVQAAGALFEEMRLLQSKDERFTAAVCEYENRLRELERAAPSPATAQTRLQTILPLVSTAIPEREDVPRPRQPEMASLLATRLFEGPATELTAVTAPLDSRSRTLPRSLEKKVIVVAIAFVLALVLAAVWVLISRKAVHQGSAVTPLGLPERHVVGQIPHLLTQDSQRLA